MSEDKIKISSLSLPLRVLLTLLSILAIVVPAVLGFVNLDYRIDGMESKCIHFEKKDEDQDIKIVNLEKRDIERRGEYAMLRSDAQRTESKLDTVIAELKRLERSE